MDAMKTDLDLLLADEAAEVLRIPVGTLYSWRSRGKGPKAARLGKRLVYRRADLEQWVTDQFHRSAA